MPLKQIVAALVLSLAYLAPAGAQETSAASAPAVTIGVAAPLSDAQEILGRQVEAGAEAAAAAHGGQAAVRFVTADTQCSADGGRAAAERFAKSHVRIVVGFLCTEAIEAALPILKDAGIPTIDVGVRANRLTERRERTGNLIWRIAPRSGDEAKAVAAYLAKEWQSQPFGLIDDGSIPARNMTDAVRRLVADAGMQPQTVDNFRPAEEKQFGLARRLQRTGVTRFFIAGDRPDIAVIARNAKSLGLDLTIVGGETLFDETSSDMPLPDGIVAIGPKTAFPDLKRADRKDLPEADTLLPPQGYFGPAYAATEIAITAASAAGKSGDDLTKVLSSETFDTALGKIRFDAKGDSNLDLYRVFEWQGDRFASEAKG
ncbi:ABC transporter substrate-binding protein [Jiella sp. M17.18]|uniref:ABC transporter substrate-binding protein n=1 Tax=Jiella sp. M17.18 TaxID=3234247 RepID=UPI0034DFA9F5